MGLSSALLLFFSLSLLLPNCSSDGHVDSVKAVDVENPVVDVTPTPIAGYTSSARGSKDVVLFERVGVVGISRLKLGSYASAYRVTLAPSVKIPERLHSKIQICFHQNASLGLCKCEDGDWKSLQKGLWSSVMSPYENRYVDVKFVGEFSGSVTVTVEEEFQRWRLLCLATGFVLLLLAPIVSSWVPFYYSSSMAIGVVLVIIILLFQVWEVPEYKVFSSGKRNYIVVSPGVDCIGWRHFSILMHGILNGGSKASFESLPLVDDGGVQRKNISSDERVWSFLGGGFNFALTKLLEFHVVLSPFQFVCSKDVPMMEAVGKVTVSKWTPDSNFGRDRMSVFWVDGLESKGMKLLPTGRKSAFYLTVYGSVLGAGSFLVHYFSMLVDSVLVKFGLSEEMHNPVPIKAQSQ
ncbi:unnamed protein product [Ilex paraguariensis]|uniref:Uncharacterized protein n=1 Tax=Ilex paraguariensis TaxID=185542 RepID=A0ABC8T0A8_9AQUA